jgi:hypothetical protein
MSSYGGKVTKSAAAFCRPDNVVADTQALRHWVAKATLSGSEVDCIAAVMPKILDGKCKMASDEKMIMASLYDCTADLPGLYLGAVYHQLIARAKATGTEQILTQVYESRVLAETQISRPVMKKFKARLRAEGILPVKASGNDD